MTVALTRRELDPMRCSVPDCEGELFLHSSCHPGTAVSVSYFDGALTVRCATCDAYVTTIAVADTPADGKPRIEL
jgi:LSD1 subclass zinc finger protein